MINRKVLNVVVYDPGQDARIPLLKVPADHKYSIEAAYATTDRATAAHADNRFALTLQDGGSDQAGTTAMSDAIGGAGGWAANTPKTFTLVDGACKLDAGDWLVLKYDENGSITPGLICVCVEYVDGIGAYANA